jgi:hypothetical protein
MTDFRGFPACECLAEWLPVYEAELQRRDLLAGNLPIYQLIGGAAASGGTHATGGAFDISDLVGDEDVWVARQMGAPATWARTRAQGFTPHLHGVLRGCPHNGPARYQIADVENGWNGLAGSSRALDDGPRPIPGRDWREGIAWALEQGDDMPYSKWDQADRDALAADVARSLLDGQTVELKRADGTVKEISVRSAVQRILNPDE